MRNALLFLLLLIALLLTACGKDIEANAKPVLEREILEFSLEQLLFNEEASELTVEFSSNLPKGTELSGVYLINSSNEPFLKVEDYTIEAPQSKVVFDVSKDLKEEINKNAKYRALIKLSISESKNSELVLDETIAGSFINMQEAYINSSLVTLSASNEPNAYTIELVSSNKLNMPDTIFIMEEPEKMEEVIEEVEETVEAAPEEKFSKLVTATELLQNFDDLFGEEIEFSGEVTQVIENDEFAISDTSKSFLINISEPYNYDSSNSVWVEVLENPPTLLEGSIVRVKGKLMDTYTYDSVAAGRVTVPYIWASSITTE